MDRKTIADWESEVQRRRAPFLDTLLLVMTIGGFLTLLLFHISMEADGYGERLLQTLPFLAGWSIMPIMWRWRGLGYRVRAWVVVALSYTLGIFVFVRGGLPGSGRVWLLLPPVFAFVLLGLQEGIWAGAASALGYVFFAFVFGLKLSSPTSPIVQEQLAFNLWWSEGASFFVVVLAVTLILWSFSRGWLEALSQASATAEKLQEQAHELEETTWHLRATMAVAQTCSSILDPQALLTEVVDQIQREFGRMGVHYVGLFLLDDATEADRRPEISLKASTGPAGERSLEHVYHMPLDGTTSIGRCIRQRKPIVTSRAEVEALLFDESFLDDTVLEIALPLRSRGNVLGALSVQSVHEAAVDEEDITVLQTMADQVAVAIDNAHLFARLGASLRDVQMAQRRYLAEAWKDFLGLKPVGHVEYIQPGAEISDNGLLKDAREAAVVHERTVATAASPSKGEESSDQAVLAVPLRLRGQVIGTLSLHETRQPRQWTSEEISLAEAIAEQVAQTVENLRLMDETQRRAARERLIAQVTARVRETLDVETVLKTAADEVQRALDLDKIVVRLAPETGDDDAARGRE